jgi:transcriptional/translational regulatory protein YebC/TACO1
MAGQSKWASIRFRTGTQDARRGKIFTKRIREITAAGRVGGVDRAMKPRLRLAIDRAKARSLSNRTIDRHSRPPTRERLR